MGYPMSWDRLVSRNQLTGGYWDDPVATGMIRGDMRRLETDSQDLRHIRAYADIAGITEAQARSVISAFFAGAASRHSLVFGIGGEMAQMSTPTVGTSL